MKSIICEASSIAKAIELCWQKAGMPQNFSVKVLEKEEKNFLGITKKPAKIALFFEEKFEPQKKRPDLKNIRESKGVRDTRDSRISRDNRGDREIRDSKGDREIRDSRGDLGSRRVSEPEKLKHDSKYEKDKNLQENLKSSQERTQKSTQKIQTQVRPQTQVKTQAKIQDQAKPQVKIQEQVKPQVTTQVQVKTQEKAQEQVRLQAQLRPLGEPKTQEQMQLVEKTQVQVGQIEKQRQVTKTQEPTKLTQEPITQAREQQTQAQKEQVLGQENFIRQSPWTEEMIETSCAWVQGMLEKMNLQNVKFSVNISSNNIRFHFDQSLMENKHEQKELFRNFAFLLMQTLRYKFKKQFRNLKAVFTCGA